MKTDMKLSARMILFIIISCVIVVAGVIMGTVFQFVGNGFFNYGAEWTSDKSVTLTWYYVDLGSDKIEGGEDELKGYCEDAFADQGISYYAVSYGTADDGTGGDIVYKFTSSTESDKIDAACTAISASIAANFPTVDGYTPIYLSSVYSHSDVTMAGASKALMMAGIAVASIVVFEFLYVLIRYKMSMALGAVLASAHNLALYIALLALCRIPIGTSMFAFAVIVVLLSMVGSLFIFGKLRKNMKEESLQQLTSAEIVDKSATEVFKTNILFIGSLIVLAVIMFVLMSISSLSPLAIISPVLCALVAFVSCAYGTLFFMPSVYARFKQIGLRFQRKKKTPKTDAKTTGKGAGTGTGKSSGAGTGKVAIAAAVAASAPTPATATAAPAAIPAAATAAPAADPMASTAVPEAATPDASAPASADLPAAEEADKKDEA